MGELPYLADLLLQELVEAHLQVKHSYGQRVHEQTSKGAYVPTNISLFTLGSEGNKLQIVAGLIYPAYIVSSAVILGDRILS